MAERKRNPATGLFDLVEELLATHALLGPAAGAPGSCAGHAASFYDTACHAGLFTGSPAGLEAALLNVLMALGFCFEESELLIRQALQRSNDDVAGAPVDL